MKLKEVLTKVRGEYIVSVPNVLFNYLDYHYDETDTPPQEFLDREVVSVRIVERRDWGTCDYWLEIRLEGVVLV